MNTFRLLFLSTMITLVAGVSSVQAIEGTAVDGAELYETKGCNGCHGADGRTPIMPIYPKISGQNADYTYNQLRDFKNGARNNGQSAIMLGLLAVITEEEMRAIADWLSTQ